MGAGLGRDVAPPSAGFSLDVGIQCPKNWGFEGRWIEVRIRFYHALAVCP